LRHVAGVNLVKPKLETSTAAAAILAAAHVNGPAPERQTSPVSPERPGSKRAKSPSSRQGVDHRPRKFGDSQEATGPPPALAAPRFLIYDDLKRLRGIIYCRVHLQRLEDAGNFPQRVQISAGRIGWLQREVDAWIEARAAARNPRPAPVTHREPPRETVPHDDTGEASAAMMASVAKAAAGCRSASGQAGPKKRAQCTEKKSRRG
jgi:prophage regulatory protein